MIQIIKLQLIIIKDFYEKVFKNNIIYIDLCELYFITSKYLRPYLLLIIDNKIIIYASVNYSYLLKQKNYSNYYFKYIN